MWRPQATGQGGCSTEDNLRASFGQLAVAGEDSSLKILALSLEGVGRAKEA